MKKETDKATFVPKAIDTRNGALVGELWKEDGTVADVQAAPPGTFEGETMQALVRQKPGTPHFDVEMPTAKSGYTGWSPQFEDGWDRIFGNKTEGDA